MTQGGKFWGLTAATGLCVVVSIGTGQKAGADKPAPQFLRDVAPILDKQGCSTAGCHGKFGGRGGFQVSLLTLSPQDDYEPIIVGSRGRRVNFVEPDKSLLLLKATGKVPHGGGERFKVGSPEYQTMRDWIAAGAPYSQQQDAQPTGFTISPPSFSLPKVGATRQLKVVAHFSDGTSRDITRQANYESTDTAVASVDASGLVKGTRWGGGAVVVRYLGNVQAAFLTLAREDAKPYPKTQATNFIDEIVQANLKRMNVVPSRLTTDSEFLRRVMLDVCGRLPKPEEVTAFVADKAPDKRAKMIDRLLETPDYVDVRTLRLGDMLRINPQRFGGNITGERRAALFTEWVRDAVSTNMPYDEFVRELLKSQGSTIRDGATNFYLVERSPEDRMETIGQAFLGQRMSCARCHKHPFDRWTTDDYWNFAAFMGRVAIRGRDSIGVQEEEVYYEPGARVINQSVTGKRGKEARPTFLGDKEPLNFAVLAQQQHTPVGTGQQPNIINAFADWCVSSKNPYFAKATVNRMWSHYLGRGVVHPVDDMRATTPPSVPGLLDALAKDFVAHKYDAKHTIRTILNSRTYQTASEVNATNKLDDKFFSHFYPRPMMGEVLLDTLNQATGNNERFGDFPLDYKVVKLSLPVGSYFLETFGRSHREFLADLDPKVEPTLVQTLHILNSPYINDKVRSGQGVVGKLLSDKTVDDAKLVRALYLQTFNRAPSPKESKFAQDYIKKAPKRDEAAQDLMWVLISSREFYFVS